MKKTIFLSVFALFFSACSELTLPQLPTLNLGSGSMELPADITSAKYYPECKYDESIAGNCFSMNTMKDYSILTIQGWQCKFEERMDYETKRPNTTEQVAHKAGSWQKYRETLYRKCLESYKKSDGGKKYDVWNAFK